MAYVRWINRHINQHIQNKDTHSASDRLNGPDGSARETPICSIVVLSSLFKTVVCCLNICAKQIVVRGCGTVKIWSQRKNISERYQDVKVLFEEIYDLMVFCCQPRGFLVTRINNQCWVETSKISCHCRFYCTILHSRKRLQEHCIYYMVN